MTIEFVGGPLCGKRMEVEGELMGGGGPPAWHIHGLRTPVVAGTLAIDDANWLTGVYRRRAEAPGTYDWDGWH